MAQYNDLSALFYQIYAPKLRDLQPASSKMQEDVPFQEDKRVGLNYIYPVVLSAEHGVTYGGTGATAFSLNASVAAVYADATLTPSEVVIRSSMSNGQARRAATDAQAFVKATDRVIKATLASISKRIELEMLYGKSPGGIGVVSANSAGTLTLTAASWSAGIWAGMEGCILEAWTAVGGTQHNGDLTVTSVDLTLKKVVVSGTSAAVVANDLLFPKGAQANGILGLDAFLTTSGSVLGINNSTYALWAGNVFDCGSAPLTLAKIESASAIASSRGLEDDAILYTSPGAFANLVSDEAALRRYNGSQRSAERGSESLEFYAANGKITVKAHKYVKDGDAFLFSPKDLKRIGASEITFKDPTNGEEAAFFQLENTNGVELRAWSDQALLVEAPARCVKFKNILST